MQEVKLKTLASCKPSEFLKQTNRIRKSVENWLEVTKIMETRSKKPELEVVPEDASEEEKAEIILRNKKAFQKQSKKNIMQMLDAIMDEHPDETLELLALCCFVEPENVDDYSVSTYLNAFTELIEDETVWNFFTSLGKLAGMLG